MPYPEQWMREAIEDAADCATFPIIAPEGEKPPYIVYRRTSTQRERYLEGQAGQPRAEFEVEIYADTYIGTKDIAEKVRIACDTFKQSTGPMIIDDVQLTDERDGDAVDLEGRGKPTYMVLHTYTIRWTEDFPRS
jgi:hypothetical protein